MYKRYILVCERSWRGVREASLDLASKDIPSTVLVKGLVDKEVREMITRRKWINNVFIPEKIFTPFLFIYIFATLIIFPKRGISVFLSKEKTYNRLGVFKKVFPRMELAMVYD